MSTDSMQAAINQMFMGFLGAIDTWLVAVLMLALFVIAAFRPQQIHDRRVFRGAIKLLGIYLLIPVGTGLLLLPQSPAEVASVISQLGLLADRVALALSVVRALRSLVPEHDAPAPR
jgi:hypothetical protein